MKMDLYAVIQKLKNIKVLLAKVPGLETTAVMLDGLVERAHEPLMIMVMGEFSTGKSTFINAMVGKEVAAVAATPTTAVITKLCYGEQDQVTIHYRDGNEQTVSPEEFAKLTSQQDIKKEDSIHKNIDYVERSMNLAVLQDINIIDSPGLNANFAGHTEATEHFVKNADTVFWMFSAEKALSLSEQREMERLDSRLKPIAIINKMDQFDEDEEECSEEEFIADKAEKLKGKVTAVVGISAIYAMKAAQEINQDKKAALFAASNFAELQNIVVEKIIPAKDEYKINSLADEMGGFVETCMKETLALEKSNKQYADTDYNKYVENKASIIAISDAVGECMQSLAGFFTDNKLNPSALYLKGLDYYWGIISEQNYDKAVEAFERAAIENHLGAQNCLYEYYYSIDDKAKAIHWLTKIANQGVVVAQCQLADCYREGYGVDKDYVKAVEYYNQAAAQGDLDAVYWLGEAYLEGCGVDVDDTKAIEYFRLGAEQGDADCQCELGICCANSTGVQKDLQQAVYWYQEAANQQNINAMYYLAECYENGWGKTKDTAQAVNWYKQAADLGNVDAQCKVAVFCLRNDATYDEAVHYFSMAAEQGDFEATNWLGRCYEEGWGVAINNEQAVKYYILAAEQGYAVAQCNLANCYISGRGIEKNPEKAAEFYEKAAKQGDTIAQFQLFRCYKNGFGVEQDEQESLRWLKKAATDELSQAQYELAKLYHDGTKVEQDYSKAFALMKKAADQGLADAQYLLGSYYENAEGCTKNLEVAENYYLQAAQQEFHQAELALAEFYCQQNRFTDAQQFADKAMQAKIDGAADTLKTIKQEIRFVEADTAEKQYKLSLMLEREGETKNSLRFLQQAAENGYASAQYKLADYYFKQNNYDSAFKWMALLAESGYADAFYPLAIYYEHGYGCSINREKAKEYYLKAVDQNDYQAAKRVGELYYQDKDFLKAKEYLGIAAAFNIDNAKQLFEQVKTEERIANAITPDAENNLALEFYKNGDYNNAFELFKKAALAGYAVAQYNLAYCYERGYGVTMNTSLSFDFYSRAASQNYADAIYKLGECYRYGFGVKKDLVKALEYYQKAASQGSDDACVRIAVYYMEGKEVQKDYFKAMRFLQQPAQNGNAEAQYCLGKIYADGDGVEQNKELAFRWMKQAAEHGYKDAMYMLGDYYAIGFGVEQNKTQSDMWYKQSGKKPKSDNVLVRLLSKWF